MMDSYLWFAIRQAQAELESDAANVLSVEERDALRDDVNFILDEISQANGYVLITGVPLASIRVGIPLRENEDVGYIGDWVASGKPLAAPRVGVTRGGYLEVIDGRHRLLWLAQQGWDRIPVAVSQEEAENVRDMAQVKSADVDLRGPGSDDYPGFSDDPQHPALEVRDVQEGEERYHDLNHGTPRGRPSSTIPGISGETLDDSGVTSLAGVRVTARSRLLGPCTQAGIETPHMKVGK